MSGIVEVRDSAIIAAEINTIKNRAKREALLACVEIGQRLCEAKELVQHGQWEQWLEEKVEYSQSTANNLMRIFREYGDQQIDLLGNSKSQTFENLSYSQAVALFALPTEERADFVKDNNAEDMSARQLQEAIKAKEQAEQAEKEAVESQKHMEQQVQFQTLQHKNAVAAKEEAERKLSEETERLKAELEEIKKSSAAPSKEELKKIRADLKAKVETDFKKKEEQLTLEKKTAEEKAAEIEKEYQSQLKKLELDNQSILKKQQEAEKKLALTDPDTQKFAVHFENFQRDFQGMNACISNLSLNGAKENAERLRSALEKVMESMATGIQKLDKEHQEHE